MEICVESGSLHDTTSFKDYKMMIVLDCSGFCVAWNTCGPAISTPEAISHFSLCLQGLLHTRRAMRAVQPFHWLRI